MYPLPKRFLCCIFFLFPLIALPEGTKQILLSDAGHGKIQIMPSFNSFAYYDGGGNSAPDEYRLYIHIGSTSEIIYYGFGDPLADDNTIINSVEYRIKDPSGNVVVGPSPVPLSGAGHISTFDQAVIGPMPVGGAGGYNPLIYFPSSTGDYYIEFTYSGADRCKFKYFDITVANSSNNAKNGRLWSKGWQMTADYYGYPFEGTVYVYSNDGIVTSIDFNGMQPYVFTVACNQYGCFNTGNFNLDRRSISGNYTNPQYKIFLNNPDPAKYPTGVLGSIIPPIVITPDCSGMATIAINVTQPGNADIMLNINPLPGYQAEDVQLSASLLAGMNWITWNGLNGLGQPVVNGTTFNVIVTYINGLTNLPIYDVEGNPGGFIVRLTRPTGTDPLTFWDDTLVGGSMQLNGCAYVLPNTGCHAWNGGSGWGIGDYNTINTWWYAVTTTQAPIAFTELRGPQPLGTINGVSSFCPGETNITYWVHSDPNSTSYTWGYTGTGATITQINDTTISVDFSVSATMGDITVHGNNAQCPAGPESTLPITFLPPGIVTLTPFVPVCVTAPPFLLTGGNPPGGVYYYNGNPVTTFDPAAAGPGSHPIVYEVTPPGQCVGADTQNIVVNPLPVVTLAAFAPVCIDTPPFALTGGNPPGGTYAGTGVTGGIFDPAAAGIGSHVITYTYTDANGCINSTTASITVNALPVVTLSAFAPVCISALPFILTGGAPPGGIYSGTGVAGGIFSPAVAGVGIHTIIYTYTDPAGCTNSNTNTITVNPLPVVSLAAFTPVCVDAPAFPLSGGNPVGGTYSGPGVVGGIFTPSTAGVGTHTITYTYTDINGCTNSATNTITVNALPVVTLGAFQPVCVDAPAFVLTGGNPPGGSYSGPGIAGGIFTPSSAGAGIHTITYTFTDLNGCTNSGTNTITVYALPVVTLPAFAPVCINAPPFPLSGGTPPGGTYTGPGVVGGIFNPATTGVGTFTLTYTYTDANGCTNFASNSITVLPLPGAAGGIAGPANVCQGAAGVPYTIGAIADATSYSWSIVPGTAGIITGTGTTATVNWDPAFLGSANIFVTGVNSCGNGAISAPYPVTVDPKPLVSLTICSDTVTTTAAQPIVLRGGIPLSGTWSGTGVNTGIFYPAIAGPGSHIITYTYTNTYGCVNTASRSILVLVPAPFICNNNLRDIRDNRLYKTILIGGQCWMAENLNYGSAIASGIFQFDNCVPEKYCYSDNPANCTASGGLYQWDEIMAYSASAAGQGLCPPGWHVPTQSDWTILFSNYINNGFAGAPLKSTGYSGFNANLVGVDVFNKMYIFSGFATLLWTSDSHGPYKAWAHGMNSYNPSVSLYPSYRTNAFSVRCLKD